MGRACDRKARRSGDRPEALPPRILHAARPHPIPSMMRPASRAAARGRHPSRWPFRGAARARREVPQSQCRWRSAGPGPPRMPTPATGTADCRSSGPLLVPRRQGRRRWRSQRTAWASGPAPRGAQHAPAPHSDLAAPPSAWNSRLRGPDRSRSSVRRAPRNGPKILPWTPVRRTLASVRRLPWPAVNYR